MSAPVPLIINPNYTGALPNPPTGTPEGDAIWAAQHGGVPFSPQHIAELEAQFGIDLSGGTNYQSIIDALQAQMSASQAPAWSSTQAAAEFEAAAAERMERLRAELAEAQANRDYARQLEILRLQREEAARIERERLLQERQSEYANLIGRGDSVRAVMLGLGLGGNLQPGAGKYAALPALEGAEEFRQQTQSALTGLQTKATGAPANVQIGDQGVTGLTSAEQFARTAQRGDEGIQQLLASAFGVGSRAQGMGGGISAQEFQRRVQDVTPTGIL